MFALPRSRLFCQPDKIADAFDEAMDSHVTDTPVQVQPQLPGERFRIHRQSIVPASLLQYREVKFVMFTAKNLPRHFHVAVGRNVDWRWRCHFFQRKTQRPPAQDVPLLNPGSRLQPDQLLLGLIRQADLFDTHCDLIVP